jgi:hypothetical protein
MKKFVTCRIIDAEDPAPSNQTECHEVHSNTSHKPSGLRQHIVEIYRTPKPGGSQLNTMV